MIKVWGGTGETRLSGLRRAKTRAYKPMVKSSGGQRESDGVVVPRAVRFEAVSGKGPDFGHASGGGKRKGMARVARSNYPDGQPATRTDPGVDRGMVQRERPVPTAWHHPIPEGGVTM